VGRVGNRYVWQGGQTARKRIASILTNSEHARGDRRGYIGNIDTLRIFKQFLFRTLIEFLCLAYSIIIRQTK